MIGDFGLVKGDLTGGLCECCSVPCTYSAGHSNVLYASMSSWLHSRVKVYRGYTVTTLIFGGTYVLFSISIVEFIYIIV